VTGGAFSAIAPNLQPGELLQVELPFGTCEMHAEATAPLLCVAGGTGFAPVKSLLDDLSRKRSQRHVTLFWGGRNRSGIYLPAAVERWKKLLPQFTFIPAVDDASDALALGGFHGRVDDAVRAHAPGQLHDHEVYCCGAPVMVKAVRQACVDERGLHADRFFSDVFVPGPVAAEIKEFQDERVS